MLQLVEEFAVTESKQEFIPVGCVPPTAVAIQGGLHQAPPRGSTSQTNHPPGGSTPLGRKHPLLWTAWQTGVKILPCPKLHLRVVTMCLPSHTSIYSNLILFNESKYISHFPWLFVQIIEKSKRLVTMSASLHSQTGSPCLTGHDKHKSLPHRYLMHFSDIYTII